MHEAKASRKQIQERESLLRSLSLRKSSYSWLEHEIKESLSDQALVSETQASSSQGTATEQWKSGARSSVKNQKMTKLDSKAGIQALGSEGQQNQSWTHNKHTGRLHSRAAEYTPNSPSIPQ